jgi:hypothetical protein
MKIISTLLISIFMLLPMISYAGNKNDKKRNGNESANYTIYFDEAIGGFNLIYKTNHIKPVKVYIYNDHNKLIYTDRIKESGILLRPYNFKQLKPGSYTFKIVDKNLVTIHNVFYAPVGFKSNCKVDVVPVADGRFKLTVSHLAAHPVKVRIYNDNHSLVFSETIEEPQNFSKIYNLERLSLSGCLFEVSVDNEMVFRRSFN